MTLRHWAVAGLVLAMAGATAHGQSKPKRVGDPYPVCRWTLEDGSFEYAECGSEYQVSLSKNSDGTSFSEYHVPMTKAEIAIWRAANHAQEAGFKATDAIESQIIKNHGFPQGGTMASLNHDTCWLQVDIRSGEDFIFVSVPDNPNWGGPECVEKLKSYRAKALAAKGKADAK